MNRYEQKMYKNHNYLYLKRKILYIFFGLTFGIMSVWCGKDAKENIS